MRLKKMGGLLALAAGLFALSNAPATAHDPNTPEGQKAVAEFMADYQQPDRYAPITGSAAGVSCVNGMADKYPCKNVDLLSALPLSSLGGGGGNDIWGWTDPTNNREYAVVGRTNGTAFVDVSTPTAPVYLGNLPSNGGSSSWRDIKVYKNHAFIVADQISGHGMQVFDLTRLRTVTSPQTFQADKLYTGFGPSHNIAINEDSGTAYAIGSNTCSGGPHMVDIRDPKNPIGLGCVSQDGYTHDNQCVNYKGPDTRYQGREICFNSNEDTLTIVDVTDKKAPKQLSRTGYSGAAYTHQGWLTEDQRYFLGDDELDESQGSDKHTKTYIWDVSDLTAPKNTGKYSSPATAIDHNQYIKGNLSFQSNYQAGLRILDISKVAQASLTEVGYFDVYPSSDSAQFNGTWSNYPYFKSGIVVVNAIEGGLFVLRPNVDGGGNPNPGGNVFENANNVNIPDGGAAVTSDITVSGRTGNAPATLKVGVDIKHTYRGDIQLDLVAPDGTLYRLKNTSGNDSADNIITEYTVDASSETANGTWKLQAKDVYSGDTGYIDSWKLTF